MSYLNALRLHFAGRFQANVSTVNNDPGHFDNAIFQSAWQGLQGPNMNPPNGWFNPEGDAAWRLLGCAITAAWMPTTTSPSASVPASDPVLGYSVADSDGRVPAKLVDLDPEQQLVSEIWGLQVRIADANGNTLLLADYAPAAFIDIWDRATVSAGGDADAGAMYQSVLENLRWGDVSASPFLVALQAAAADGRLSIKFNVDSFNLDYTSPQFMTGRIAGTIGPAAATEPQHLVVGRQFVAASDTTANPPANFFLPAGRINHCAGVVDADAGCLYLDLGNAIPTGAGGAMVNLGDLALGVYDPLLSPLAPAGSVIPIGTVPAATYTATDWYATTAGVVAIPIPPTLLPQVKTAPLVLSGDSGVAIAEWTSGAFVRADRFVHRMSPGDVASIPVYAMQYGQPLANVGIAFAADSSQLQTQVGSGFPFVTDSPAVATPASALGFNAGATTDANGRALLTISAADPGTPRNFGIGPTNPTGDYGIDGQVYGVRPGFADTATYGDAPINQWNFVSVLVWSGWSPKVPGAPTWYDDLQPIFQQYANLYPVMNRFLNLASYDDVLANVRLLSLAFGLAPSDPNTMPVTRDLSPAKRAAILTWLSNPLPGTPSVQAAAPRTAPAPTGAPSPAAGKGGKAMAAARRLVLQTR